MFQTERCGGSNCRTQDGSIQHTSQRQKQRSLRMQTLCAQDTESLSPGRQGSVGLLPRGHSERPPARVVTSSGNLCFQLGEKKHAEGKKLSLLTLSRYEGFVTPLRRPPTGVALPLGLCVFFCIFCVTTLTIVAVNTIQLTQPFLRPRSTDDPRRCLCCMPRRPAVIGLSFQQRLQSVRTGLLLFNSPISCVFAHRCL